MKENHRWLKKYSVLKLNYLGFEFSIINGFYLIAKLRSGSEGSSVQWKALEKYEQLSGYAIRNVWIAVSSDCSIYEF